MPLSGMTYFKAWLIFTVLSVVLAFGASLVVGFVVGAAMGIAGMSLEQVQLVCSILGMIVGIVVSFLVFRWAVDRFIVQVVAKSPGSVG